jgi:hypothetical protein
MRLRHIEVFHAVMQVGTISGAAQLLFVSSCGGASARQASAKGRAQSFRGTSALDRVPVVPSAKKNGLGAEASNPLI